MSKKLFFRTMSTKIFLIKIHLQFEIPRGASNIFVILVKQAIIIKGFFCKIIFWVSLNKKSLFFFQTKQISFFWLASHLVSIWSKKTFGEPNFSKNFCNSKKERLLKIMTAIFHDFLIFRYILHSNLHETAVAISISPTKFFEPI